MDERIAGTLKRLNAASEMERIRRVMPPSARMMAITEDTAILFNVMLRAMRAKHVLEIGMSTGFSTIWMAEAVMRNGGSVTTIEMDPKKVERASRNFEEAGVAGMIDIRHGIASDILAEMRTSGRYDSSFDFVLIDADKESTLRYFEESLHMTRAGGMIAIDNMTEPKKFSEMMAVVRESVSQNPAVRSVLVPIGNGEMVATKL